MMIELPMTVPEAFALLAAGTVAGIASTAASVASVVSHPVLLALGLSPLSANVTNTISRNIGHHVAAATARCVVYGAIRQKQHT
ncbi:MAG TPA: hypothetical protein VF482_12510 [Trebonia sp.]